MNANFKVIGLTRLGIKLESTAALEADALTTRPSELLNHMNYPTVIRKIKRKNLDDINCILIDI